MKTIYTLFFSIIITMMNSTLCAAQNNNVPDFTIQSNALIYGETQIPITSTISKTANTLTWTQSKDSRNMVTEFTIVNTTGTWDRETNTGTITMTIDASGITNTMTLIGTENELSLQMISAESGNSSAGVSFSTLTITYL